MRADFCPPFLLAVTAFERSQTSQDLVRDWLNLFFSSFARTGDNDKPANHKRSIHMKTAEPARKEKAVSRWLSFRPEIKVVDCTIRDGGLMNNHHFDDKIVKMVYETCVAAGVDYMELGYKSSRKGIKLGEHGDWKYCTEETVRRIVGANETSLKLCAMADAERCDYKEDILPKKDSVLDMIRVATYIHQIPTALDMVKDANDKGYETTVNLMAASVIPDAELNEGLEMLAKSDLRGGQLRRLLQRTGPRPGK
jgi:hypothetical protein